MFDFRKLTIVSLTSLTLCACATSKQAGTWIGAAAGAVVGGLIDDEAAAVAAGAVAGGLVGRMIGTRMDNKRTAQVLENNAPHETTVWTNRKTGTTYIVTPESFYEDGGKQCRDFQLITSIDGQDEVVRGTACRQPDGTWLSPYPSPIARDLACPLSAQEIFPTRQYTPVFPRCKNSLCEQIPLRYLRESVTDRG